MSDKTTVLPKIIVLPKCVERYSNLNAKGNLKIYLCNMGDFEASTTIEGKVGKENIEIDGTHIYSFEGHYSYTEESEDKTIDYFEYEGSGYTICRDPYTNNIEVDDSEIVSDPTPFEEIEEMLQGQVHCLCRKTPEFINTKVFEFQWYEELVEYKDKLDQVEVLIIDSLPEFEEALNIYPFKSLKKIILNDWPTYATSLMEKEYLDYEYTDQLLTSGVELIYRIEQEHVMNSYNTISFKSTEEGVVCDVYLVDLSLRELMRNCNFILELINYYEPKMTINVSDKTWRDCVDMAIDEINCLFYNRITQINFCSSSASTVAINIKDKPIKTESKPKSARSVM